MDVDARLKLRNRFYPGNDWTGEQDLSFTDTWLEQPIDDRWTACFRLAIQDDQPIISELRVIPSETRWEEFPDAHYYPAEWGVEDIGPDARVPTGGITSQLIRRIPFGALDSLPDIVGWVLSHHPEEDDTLAGVGLTVGIGGKRPGPKGPTDTELAELARDYLEAVLAGEKSPIKLLATKRGYSTHTISAQLARARDKGLLMRPPKAGKAGGRLTRRAIELIEAAQAEVAE